MDHGASMGDIHLLQPSLVWGSDTTVGIYSDNAKGALALLFRELYVLKVSGHLERPDLVE